METMRQRQMLDLDQAGQKSESIPFAKLIWADEELFGDEWLNFSEQPEQNEENDFWNNVLEVELLEGV